MGPRNRLHCRLSSYIPKLKSFCASLCLMVVAAFFAGQLLAVESYPGRNVNIIGPPPAGSGAFQDSGLRQQNEPSCAVNPANPAQICCGFNDYRGIDIPEIGDAWEGLACSRNGGHSWNSQLIPGHRADPEFSMNLDFAADPNLVAVPGGLFYNFIASDRDHVGGIYIQRFAWRNKEDGWPLVQVGGPILISKGTSGRFIDKPHMIGFLDDASTSTVSMNWSDAVGENSRKLPAGNLGMAAAVFVGNDNNDGTKIIYWSSDDWGQSWDNGTKLTESKGVNSGINLSANGDNVCAVWRRFDDTNEVSSILYACSSNRGKTFTKPGIIHEGMCPFDQVTLNGVAPAPKDIVSFRTNAFPVIAGDGQNFYAFWSDRGFADASGGPNGCELRTADNGFNPSYGRIVYSKTSNNGKSWSNPKPVEDNLNGGSFPGHQFMPAAFGANGEVVVSWIDSRDDIANLLDIDKQMIVDFWKDGEGLYRHTTDIRSARLLSGNNAGFAPSVKVSNYTRGIQRNGTGEIIGLRQMEFNLVNARMFQKGTAPFIGDYLSVTAPAYTRNSAGKWVNSNTAPNSGSPTFHIAWGDNRDVRGNAWGSADGEGFTEPSPYTPVASNSVNASIGDDTQVTNATPSVEDPPDNTQTSCQMATVKADRTRDQNIYSAPLYPQATLRSPGAVKVTGQVQRALPVYVENYSSAASFFRLDIEGQPSDYSDGACSGVASFRQYPEDNGKPCGEVTHVFVKVYPKSSAVRTVFQASRADALPAIPVSVSVCDQARENCALVSRILLNQDPLELGANLEQPDFDAVNSILAQELHNPDLLNPDLLNPDLLNLLIANPDLLNPDLLNPDLMNPDLLNLVLANPDLLNPDLINKAIANPDLLNPDLLNKVLANPDLLNPDLMNLLIANPDLLNLVVANPDLLNPDLLNLVIANPDLLNPDLLNPDLLNNLVANPDLLNPDLLNLIVANPDLLNPDLLNLLVANPDLLNPDLLNAELLNPDLLNPDLLNPDLLNRALANPDLLNPDLMNLVVANPDLLNPDLLNISILNPDLLNPDLLNPDLLNPDLLNPDLLNPDLLNLVLLNPDLLNPDLLNPDLLNPDLLNPDLLNPDLLNLLVANPDLLNPDLLNPDLLNPDLLNPDLLNAVISYSDLENPDIANDEVAENANTNYIDVTWQVKNDGNTTTGYMAQPYIAGPEDHTATQLIVSKPYLRQTTRDCLPVVESDNQVVVNIYNPPNQAPIINPNPEDEEVQGLASYWLAPGEVANVTLRIFGDPENLHSGRVGLYVNSEACNSEGTCSDQPYEITSREMDVTGPEFFPSVIIGLPTVEATGPEGGIVTFDKPTATDAGDNKTVPVSCTYESGSIVPLGSTQNTCTAQDSAGNVNEMFFVINVTDSTAPTISVTLPEDISFPIEAVDPQGAQVDYSGWITATDLVDQSVTVTCTPDSGSWFGLGTTLINCTATDDYNNSTEATIEVSIEDSTPPVLTVPDITVTVEAAGPDGAIVEFDVTASDVADTELTLSCSQESGSLFPLGTTTVSCDATDASANSASAEFDVLVEDTTPPNLTVPELTIVVEATGSTGASVTFDVSASDVVDQSLSISCGKASGDTFGLGTTVVDCSVTDAAGNTVTGQFSVTVADTTKPVLTLPANITTEASGASGSIVTFTPTASDIVDGAVSVSCSPASGSTFAIAVTTVSCSALDKAGNSNSGSFTVTVVDTTQPVLSLPANITKEATGASGAAVTFSATASDIVDGALTVTCSPASGSTFAIAATTVSCSATDDAGNTVSGNFTVTVVDTTQPVLSLPANMAAEATAASGAVVTFSPTANDIVDGALVVSCSPNSGSTFAMGATQVSCSATDSNGNQASGGFSITVRDTIAPVLSVPGYIQQEATSLAGNLVNYTVGVTDAVHVASLVCVPGSGSTFAIGATTVGCTAVDDAGNTGSGSFVVEITDSTAPSLSVPANIGPLEAISPTGNLVEYVVTATDLPGSTPLVACAPASGSVFAIGTTTVNCTATDAKGNVGTGSLTVTVVDTVPPVLVLPNDMIVSAQSANGATVSYIVTATDDADDSVTIACAPASGTQFAIGTTTVNCTATDNANLVTTGAFKVTVRTDIIWVTPTEDPASGSIGPNFNFRWGYGVNGVTQNSSDMIATPSGNKGTAPLKMFFRGATCNTGMNELVDLDAGNSSLRYSSKEWQLNWQTGQSSINGAPLVKGCYKLEIPRAPGKGSADYKQVILQ